MACQRRPAAAAAAFQDRLVCLDLADTSKGARLGVTLLEFPPDQNQHPLITDIVPGQLVASVLPPAEWHVLAVCTPEGKIADKDLRGVLASVRPLCLVLTSDADLAARTRLLPQQQQQESPQDIVYLSVPSLEYSKTDTGPVLAITATLEELAAVKKLSQAPAPAPAPAPAVAAEPPKQQPKQSRLMALLSDIVDTLL